jgi:hypothetical protein
MFKQSVAVDATLLFPSPSGKGPIRFLLLGFLLLLRVPHVVAQTSITGAQIRNPLTPVAALPSTCTPYSVYFLTTTSTAYICAATNAFTPLATGTGGGSGLPAANGTPGYLFSNGTTVSWGNLLTGGSGALDCASIPGQCDVTSIVPLKGAANTWTGANDFHSALLRIPESTVSGLPPASANNGREFMVTDGASTCDATIGGGSTRVLVQSNGTIYVAPNCSTGGGGSGSGVSSTSQLTDFAPTLTSGTMIVQPGRIRFGTMPCTNFSIPATASISSMSGGTGVAKLYVSSTCALVMQYPNSLTISAWGTLTNMTAQPVVTPIVPSDAWYVADVNLGPSAITAVTDKRSITGMDATKAGSGITEDCTLGPCLISTDPAVVPTLGGVNAYTGTQDNTAASITKPSRTVSSDPSGSCSQASEVVLSTASGNSFSCLPVTPPDCTATCSWHAMGGGSGSSGGSGGGGNLSGTPTNHGVAIGATGSNLNFTAAGTAGYVLTSNGPSGDPTFQAPTGGNGSGGGSESGSAGSQYVATGGPFLATDGSAGDTMVAATGALPAIPNGACWDYEAFIVSNRNAGLTNMKVWLGPAMTVGSVYTSGSSLAAPGVNGFNPGPIWLRGQVCNNNGSQTAQTATLFANWSNNFTQATGYNYSGSMSQDTSTTSLEMGVSIATASGSVDGINVQSFRVWRTQ